MKIAIDLDGTAWYHTELLSLLARALKGAGHEVGILTAHGSSFKQVDLADWKRYAFPEPDFYIYKSQEDKDRLKPTEGNNGIWKAEQVTKHNIDYLIGDLDGNDTYVEYFRKVHPYKLVRVWGEK